jgi:hypothetical protein
MLRLASGVRLSAARSITTEPRGGVLCGKPRAGCRALLVHTIPAAHTIPKSDTAGHYPPGFIIVNH